MFVTIQSILNHLVNHIEKYGKNKWTGIHFIDEIGYRVHVGSVIPNFIGNCSDCAGIILEAVEYIEHPKYNITYDHQTMWFTIKEKLCE